jgi:hypothetical protein
VLKRGGRYDRDLLSATEKHEQLLPLLLSFATWSGVSRRSRELTQYLRHDRINPTQKMASWDAPFQVKQVKQLALIASLSTHHDKPPPPNASSIRNHCSPKITSLFSTVSVTARLPFASSRFRSQVRDVSASIHLSEPYAQTHIGSLRVSVKSRTQSRALVWNRQFARLSLSALLGPGSSHRKALMVKVAITGLAMAALQIFAAEPAPKIGEHCADMRIIRSDANTRWLKLGYKKAVVIDLPIDIKEVWSRTVRS